MPATPLIAPPARADLLAGLPPLLSVVPQAGRPLFAYAGFGAVLLLLLVPPFTLLATPAVVALIVATALAALVVLSVAILEAPFVLVRLLRRHLLLHLSLPVLHIRKARARRV